MALFSGEYSRTGVGKRVAARRPEIHTMWRRRYLGLRMSKKEREREKE